MIKNNSYFEIRVSGKNYCLACEQDKFRSIQVNSSYRDLTFFVCMQCLTLPPSLMRKLRSHDDNCDPSNPLYSNKRLVIHLENRTFEINQHSVYIDIESNLPVTGFVLERYIFDLIQDTDFTDIANFYWLGSHYHFEGLYPDFPSSKKHFAGLLSVDYMLNHKKLCDTVELEPYLKLYAEFVMENRYNIQNIDIGKKYKIWICKNHGISTYMYQKSTYRYLCQKSHRKDTLFTRLQNALVESSSKHD